MKKSDKKRMVYDAMAVRLAVALEHFVDSNYYMLFPMMRQDKCTKNSRAKASDMLKSPRVEVDENVKETILNKMKYIQRQRNEIVHQTNKEEVRPYLTYEDFRKFRQFCSQVDECFAKVEIDEESGSTSVMRRIMFHSLRYDMGNAGDLLKHGALSITVRWWCQYHGANLLRFADPFGGCPWEDVENPNVKYRLKRIDEYFDPFVSSCLWDHKYYYNSGHIVARAVKEVAGNVRAKIFTSDKDEIARSDLEASKWKAPHFELLEKEYPDFECENGYSILKHAKNFDLIFIDPYCDFLGYNLEKFNDIYNVINENPEIFIMVFALDMYTEQERQNKNRKGRIEKHEEYCKIKSSFKNCAISLRCPAIPDSEVKGDCNYDMEILLISKQLEANPNATELRDELRDYADALTEVLPLGGKKIEFWPK